MGLLSMGFALVVGFADRDLELAEKWAPIIFHEEAAEFEQTETGFNPVETLVDPRFDGNLNLRDNVLNIFRVSPKEARRLLEEVPIFFHVIETRTHFYINYILYHAVDWGFRPHAHDTENVWTIIRKGPQEDLVAHVLNAHGFPMIYSRDVEREARWRSRLAPGFARQFLHILDPNSEYHHQGASSYTIDRDSLRLHVFVTAKTHALYKANLSVWNSTQKSGSVFMPQNCRECWRQIPEQVQRGKLRAYHLRPWGDFLNDLLKSEVGFSDGESERDVISAALATQFQTKNLKPMNFLNPHQREINLPSFLMPGYGETRAGANLFHAVSFKTPYRLSDPARVHIYFEGESGGISTFYLKNSLMEPVPRAAPVMTRARVLEASLTDWFRRALGF